MRIVFLGVGHWHTPLLLKPLMEQPGVELVGVSDADPGIAGNYAARLSCNGAGSYRQLCSDLRPDFAFALAPHDEMAAMARYLIEAGIPFAMEKPAGVNGDEVAELARMARARSHFAAIPFVFRYTGLMRAIAEVAAGESVHYAGFRLIAGPPERYVKAGCGWMLDPSRSGGGAAINLGIHFLDLCRVLWPGEQIGVSQALCSNSASGLPVEDHALIALSSGSRTAVIEAGYLYPAPVGVYDMHFSIRTDHHYFVARGPDEFEISDSDGSRRTVAGTTTNVPHYPTFVADTLACFKAGRKPVADLDDMLAAIRLLDECYRRSRVAL